MLMETSAKTGPLPSPTRSVRTHTLHLLCFMKQKENPSQEHMEKHAAVWEPCDIIVSDIPPEWCSKTLSGLTYLLV